MMSRYEIISLNNQSISELGSEIIFTVNIYIAGTVSCLIPSKKVMMENGNISSSIQKKAPTCGKCA